MMAGLSSPQPAHASWASDPQAWLQCLFAQAVHRAQAMEALAALLPAPPHPPGCTWVVGAGKAAAVMAAALEAAWPLEAPLAGAVVLPYGHLRPVSPAHAPMPDCPGRIQRLQAAHPLPDGASHAAARRMLEIAGRARAGDRVIALISGGGSSVLSLPAPGLAASDKHAVLSNLLRSGAAIGEINTVRKHLSAIKGGRLALACGTAPVHTLLISDVPGDDPSLIASGPTLPDASSCADALAILQRHGVGLPAHAQAALERGQWETPKPGDQRLARCSHAMVCTPSDALAHAAQWARAQGLAVHVLGDALEGEASDLGQAHATLARAVAQGGTAFAPPCLVLSGGETSVTFSADEGCGGGGGRGGRNGEYLMALAQALQGHPRIWALAADTDGIDGSGDNAGAVVTPSTLTRAAAAGLRVEEALACHDAYGFFGALGDRLHTGPTLTNVNDFRAVLVL